MKHRIFREAYVVCCSGYDDDLDWWSCTVMVLVTIWMARCLQTSKQFRCANTV